jgi:hypothetical protein
MAQADFSQLYAEPPWLQAELPRSRCSSVSFQEVRVSLNGSRDGLPWRRCEPLRSRVNPYGSRVSLLAFRMSLHGSRVRFQCGSKFILGALDEPSYSDNCVFFSRKKGLIIVWSFFPENYSERLSFTTLLAEDPRLTV